MKHYLHESDIDSYVSSRPGEFIDDPNEAPITDIFEQAGIRAFGDNPVTFRPSRYPILKHLGEQPLKILDIAAGDSPLGLYLASQGHMVTVSDVHETPLAWQNEAANKMRLDSMKVIESDVLRMKDDQAYDVVIASMLLHFLDRTDAKTAAANMQAATKVGGLTTISVYTTDNPVDELRPPRNLARLYDGASELTDLFDSRYWQTVERREGVSGQAISRSCFGASLMLLPSIAEVIMQKTGQPVPAGASYAPNFSDWNDFQTFVTDD